MSILSLHLQTLPAAIDFTIHIEPMVRAAFVRSLQYTVLVYSWSWQKQTNFLGEGSSAVELIISSIVLEHL